jgi:hypothetical protein
MTRMTNHKYLDPAYSIILEFGEGKLSRGIDVVAEIVKRDRASVYRWMRPKERNGRGGFIPAGAQAELCEYSKSNPVPRRVRDFFLVKAAA